MKTVICFDLDGTIIHSRGIWGRALREGLELVPGPEPLPEADYIRQQKEYRFVWDYDDMDTRSLVGPKWWEFMNRRFIATYMEMGINRERAEKAALYVRPHILDPRNYSLYPDTVSVLEKCREKGAGLVLLSNNYPEADETLRQLGLYDYFDSVIISGILGYDKPDIRIFEEAKKSCHGDRYIMVGDNLRADIAGAKAAGMTTVYVHRGFSPEADYCFEDLSSVPDLIEPQEDKR